MGETSRTVQPQACLLGVSGRSGEPLHSPKKSQPARQLVLIANLGTHKVNDVLLQACKSVEKSSTKVFETFFMPQIQEVYTDHSLQGKHSVWYKLGQQLASPLHTCPSKTAFKVKLPDGIGGDPAVWSACRACPGFRVYSWSSWGWASCWSAGSHWGPVGKSSERGERRAAHEWVIAEKLTVRSHSPPCRTGLEDGHQKTQLG